MNTSSQTDLHIIDDSIFRIGKVVEIIGQAVKVRVDTGKNTSSLLYKGEIIHNISVRGYVKIKKGFEEMVGVIEGESVKEEQEFVGSYLSNKEKIHRILTVKILGFIENDNFKRGIKELPLIDNTCYLLTKEEFNKIHKFVEIADKPIEIGKLENDDGQKIELGINKLFASHIGIFGNTGSGKSYTLAKLYRELFKIFKENKLFIENAKIFLIDFNGEYIDDNVIIDQKYKNRYRLTTEKKIEDIPEESKFPVHIRTLKNTTFWSIFLEATEKTQTPFLNRAIKDTYIEDKLKTDSDFLSFIKDKIIQSTSVNGKNIDRAIPQDFLYELAGYLDNASIKELAAYFKENLFGGNENISFYLETRANDNFSGCEGFNQKINREFEKINKLNISKLSEIKKIGLRIIIKYYDEMIRGFSNREHLSPLIKRIDKRIFDLEKVLTLKTEEDSKTEEVKNFTIISLREVNIDIRKMVPMLLVKELYDQKKRNNIKNQSLHLIIDEAHNILSHDSNRESEQWKDYRLETFEEIIKEGRKFGTFLTIASQRPSDISPTIISQLHNYFLHRLINNNDLTAIEKTISYLDKVSADSIPNLATGTCILAGLMAQIPVIVKINEISNIENQPQSHNIDLLKEWKV